MGAKVTVVVHLPGKVPAKGADIVGRSKKALEIDKREWLGTTGPDGSYTWLDFEAGRLGGFYDFKVIYVDDDGVSWTGNVSEWIAHSLTLMVTLRPGDQPEMLSISRGAIESLEEHESGRGIIESIRQMQNAQNNGLSRAVMTLSTWTIEGLIRFRAQNEKIWRPEWGDKDLRALVVTKEIADMFPPQLKEKVQGLAEWRRSHSHMNSARSVPEDAQIACSVVKELIEAWYGRRATKGSGHANQIKKSVYDPPSVKKP